MRWYAPSGLLVRTPGTPPDIQCGKAPGCVRSAPEEHVKRFAKHALQSIKGLCLRAARARHAPTTTLSPHPLPQLSHSHTQPEERCQQKLCGGAARAGCDSCTGRGMQGWGPGMEEPSSSFVVKVGAKGMHACVSQSVCVYMCLCVCLCARGGRCAGWHRDSCGSRRGGWCSFGGLQRPITYKHARNLT